MDKRFLMVLGVIVAIFAGALFFGKEKEVTSVYKPSVNTFGKVESKVKVVEYGDFQCNACQGYSETTEAVRKKYADKIDYQFRNLPLTSIHPNAFAGARAAQAAAKQGKFWEMHDLLYKYQNWAVWTTSSNPNTNFEQYANQLGLDIIKFKSDFASEETNGIINADIAAFEKTGQDKATPTFFINDKYYELSKFLDKDGRPSVDAFSKILDELIADSSKSE